MPRFFILLPIPITLDFLPFFCAFVFHSSWTNEAFPSRHTNNTHTPHFGHESRPAFPASLSHTHTRVQKTLQRSLVQAKTQLYGAVATRYSPAQAEWGLDTKQDERETLKLLDNLFFFQALLPIAFLGMCLAYLKFLASTCRGFVPIGCRHIYTGKKSLSAP